MCMPGEQQRNEISDGPQPEPDPNQPMVYQIRVKSHLAEDWTDWFEGLTITLENTGYTLLTGPVVDQAALHGLLKKIRDLGMSLISVNYLERDLTTFRSDQGNPVDDRP
jgi:hypothetical protein